MSYIANERYRKIITAIHKSEWSLASYAASHLHTWWNESSLTNITLLAYAKYLLKICICNTSSNLKIMKLFRTNNIETVEFCQDQFGFDKPSVWARSVRNFDSKFVASENAFCKLTLSL